MFILVNVERHKNVMSEIVHNLVADYGVPISIVDNIQKVCPTCTANNGSDDASKSDETTENDNVFSIVRPISEAPKSTSSSRSSVADNGNDFKPTPRKVAKLESDDVEPSTSTFTDIFPTAASIQDTTKLFEDAIVNAFQNKNGLDKPFFPTKLPAASSEDGNSNSSNFEQDEDDATNNICINPQLLASFITSTPNIFANTTDFGNLSQSSTASSAGAAHRKIPIKDIPPCLSTNGKFRRGRIVYTQHELDVLEKYYAEDPNACADPGKRDELCKLLKIDYHRLKVWFQNRRRKDKLRNQAEEDGANNNQSISSLSETTNMSFE